MLGLALLLAMARWTAEGAENLPRLASLRVASGLAYPVAISFAPGDDSRMFVVERLSGRIRIADLCAGTTLPAPFLDLDDRILDQGSEGGFLGLAFHPGYSTNGRFFVSYTDLQGALAVAEHRVSDAPALADPASERILLRIAKPHEDHFGGHLAFGPDGYLYIGVGDGGGAYDPGNRAQDRTEPLGKMLRIDVDTAAPYAIPPDNPYVADPLARPEIWASGLRNPWRWAFDRRTGELYIGDVGQDQREEIDVAAAGAGGENYGWRCLEGSVCTGLPGCDCTDATLSRPVWEYAHDPAAICQAVIGGFVYRGCGIPSLQGSYFFADYCEGRIWSLRQAGGRLLYVQERTEELVEASNQGIDLISAFGEDPAGELYYADYYDGEVFKIVPPAPSASLTLEDAPLLGAVATLKLSSPADPGRGYACALALASDPGILLSDGRRVPLSNDALLSYSLGPNPVWPDTLGTLDSGGQARVRLMVPDEPALAGLTVYAACAVLDGASSLGIRRLSCPVALTFVAAVPPR